MAHRRLHVVAAGEELVDRARLGRDSTTTSDLAMLSSRVALHPDSGPAYSIGFRRSGLEPGSPPTPADRELRNSRRSASGNCRTICRSTACTSAACRRDKARSGRPSFRSGRPWRPRPAGPGLCRRPSLGARAETAYVRLAEAWAWSPASASSAATRRVTGRSGAERLAVDPLAARERSNASRLYSISGSFLSVRRRPIPDLSRRARTGARARTRRSSTGSPSARTR